MHTETGQTTEDENLETSVEYSGSVCSGMGKGRQFVSLRGYTEQFRERLGYEPFPGTLNVELINESIQRRPALNAATPIPIDSWSDDERTFGPVNCYPAEVETTADERYESAHVIIPKRTDHDENQLELIAPDELRDQLNLADGDLLTIYVKSE